MSLPGCAKSRHILCCLLCVRLLQTRAAGQKIRQQRSHTVCELFQVAHTFILVYSVISSSGSQIPKHFAADLEVKRKTFAYGSLQVYHQIPINVKCMPQDQILLNFVQLDLFKEINLERTAVRTKQSNGNRQSF